MDIAGPAAAALRSLTPDQLEFIQKLPKAELHAHLNGSIPIATLQELAKEYSAHTPPNSAALSNEAVQAGLKLLLDGPSFNRITDFFALFPTIYALTSTPSSLVRATRAVLSSFLDGENPQCDYLELRTIPKETTEMTREVYLRVVLEEIARYGKHKVRLIMALDRKMEIRVMKECMDLAIKLKNEGKNIAGVDLCGNPMAGDVEDFRKSFQDAKDAGLGVTLHIAETIPSPPSENLKLLSFSPDRLGHATFLDEEAKEIVLKNKTCIEICLSSNLLCKTVPALESHHITYYLQHKHPIAICTDDSLPFRTSLFGEYALLLAQSPYGLGLSEAEVKAVGQMSLEARFNSPDTGVSN